MPQKLFDKNQINNFDSEYYDYSIFRGQSTNKINKKKNTKKTYVNTPLKHTVNVASLSAVRIDKQHRINAEKKRIIVRRRRIVFGTAVLILVLIVFGIISLLLNLIFGLNSDNSNSIELSASELESIEKFNNFNSVFYTEQDNETVLSLDKMLHTYTLVDDGENAVVKTKNNASYFAWDAIKYVWLDNKEYIAQLKQNLREVAMSKNGYIWSSEQSTKLPVTGSIMFDTNVKFISAVCDICLWEVSDEFLHSMDSTKVDDGDISKGLTVGEKLDKAIEYVLDYQYSKKNKIIRSVDSRSLGTRYGASGNYWYNYRFGYSDAYNNIYFYDALNKLNKLYSTSFCNDSEKSEKYAILANDVHEGFEIFWDNEKQRYVGTIDVNDEKHDYGFTFLNIEAVYYGLADKEKAKAIYSWIDGERIIESDTSKGKDIYFHGFSPRVNTLMADAYWWNSIDNSLRYDGNADYGMYWQNGGASLLLSYYDIMARFKTFGPDNAMPIMKMMLTEYEKDKIIRNNLFDGSLNTVASNGDFPESGVVPSVFVYGLMGISTDGISLSINPTFPVGTGAVGIKNLSFSGNKFSILNNNMTTYIFSDYFSFTKMCVGGFPANSEVLCISYKNNEPVYQKSFISDDNGFVSIDERIGQDVFIKLTPEYK